MSQALSTTESLVSSYRHLREDAGLIELSDVRFLEVRGEDRKAWLQGQVTSDVGGVAEYGASPFCVCKPTGQLVAMGHLWSFEDRYLLAMDINSARAFLERAQQMIVMEDVSVTELSNKRLLSLQGPQASALIADKVDLPGLDAGQIEIEKHPVVCLRSNRAGYGGWDFLLHGNATRAANVLRKQFDPIDPRALDIARLEAGIPVFGRDTDERTIPSELGPAFEAVNISYHKGCYVGQEVLMRIHSRGHTNRTWMGLILAEPVEDGDLISHPSRSDAGVITSAVVSPEIGPIAAGMIRNEVAVAGEVVRVEAPGGSVEAEIIELPFLGTL